MKRVGLLLRVVDYFVPVIGLAWLLFDGVTWPRVGVVVLVSLVAAASFGALRARLQRSK